MTKTSCCHAMNSSKSMLEKNNIFVNFCPYCGSKLSAGKPIPKGGRKMPIFITTIHSKAGSDILYKASLSVNKSNEFIKLALRKCNLDYKYEVNNRNQFTIESGGLVITRAIQIAES